MTLSCWRPQACHSLKTERPDLYRQLFQESGFEDAALFDLYFEGQKPQAEQVDWKIEQAGSKVIAYGIDPATGELKSISHDLGFNPDPNTEVRTQGGRFWLIDKDSGTARVIGGPGPSGVGGKNPGNPGGITFDEIPTMDQFVDEFMQTPEGKELIDVVQNQAQQTLTPEARRAALKEQLGGLYEQTVAQIQASQGSGGGQTAADWFSETQLAKGAAKAGMTISEFSGLSVDEANKFIYGEEADDDGGSGGMSDEEFLENMRKLQEGN